MRTEELDDIGIHFVRDRGQRPESVPDQSHARLSRFVLSFRENHSHAHQPGIIRRKGRRRFRCRCSRSTRLYGFSDRPWKMGMVFWVHDLWVSVEVLLQRVLYLLL